jgi:Tol biopolymer transport system component
MDLERGNRERILTGFSIINYDLSSDCKEVVFSTQPPGKAAQLWLASLDRSYSPKRIAEQEELSPYSGPYFGADGQILFLAREGKNNYLNRMSKDGSHRSSVLNEPVIDIYGGVSPDRRWIAIGIKTDVLVAMPTDGGMPRVIYNGYRPVAWAPDGKYFYFGVSRSSRTDPGQTLAIPLQPGEGLPKLPIGGIRKGSNPTALFPGSRLVDGWNFSPGPDPSVHAYIKTTSHRNLYRIRLHEN